MYMYIGSNPPSQVASSMDGQDPFALKNTQQEDGAAPPDSSLEMDRIFKHIMEGFELNLSQ